MVASDFSVCQLNLQPGQSFPPQSCVPLLAGGFSSMFPEAAFPLSAALQLNHDMTNMSSEQLAHFARAELGRINRVNIKTYAVDPNMHVCVIATDAEKLETFLDTYGGILEVDPVLYKANHRDHPQTTDIDIQPTAEGSYQVTLSQRAPIDLSACTYCGACGPVCPVDCIDPQLYVDFEQCTFCRECEKVCGQNAVDIYGVIRKTITTPAVIMLGEFALDLPEKQNGIFGEQDIQKYFSTLFTTSIEETVTCDQALCHHSSKAKAGCSACVNSCSYGAITGGPNGIQIDYQLCMECGQCVAVCPTGAMQHGKLTDSAFIEFLSSYQLPAGATVVLGDEEQFHSLWWNRPAETKYDVVFMKHPSQGAIAPLHLLYLLAQGAGNIVVLDSGASHLRKVVDQVNATISLFFNKENAVRLALPERFFELDLQPVQQICPDRHQNPTLLNRRKKTSELIRQFSQHNASAVELQWDIHGPYATLLCDDVKCTQCFACLNECKLQALKAGPGAMSLTVDRSLCVGCGACTAVCPEDALTLKVNTIVNDDFFADSEIAKTEPVVCLECGKEFGSRKSFEKVMAVLQSRNMTDKGHFEYCEDCRVIKMFEKA